MNNTSDEENENLNNTEFVGFSEDELDNIKQMATKKALSTFYEVIRDMKEEAQYNGEIKGEVEVSLYPLSNEELEEMPEASLRVGCATTAVFALSEIDDPEPVGRLHMMSLLESEFTS